MDANKQMGRDEETGQHIGDTSPHGKRYQERECLTCGRIIREAAYSGKDGNFRKHVKSHESGKEALDMPEGVRKHSKAVSRG